MKREWSDRSVIERFFDWEIFDRYFEDNDFKSEEEEIKIKLSNPTKFSLNKNDDVDDDIVSTFNYLLEQNEIVDVSQYLIRIILRWNYYTNIRNENKESLEYLKKRLKINSDIKPLPRCFHSFREYFFFYFPLYLVETQQLINNKKLSGAIKEYEVHRVNDLSQVFSYKAIIYVEFKNTEEALQNIFTGDLILIRFVPKLTEKNDSPNFYAPIVTEDVSDEDEFCREAKNPYLSKQDKETEREKEKKKKKRNEEERESRNKADVKVNMKLDGERERKRRETRKRGSEGTGTETGTETGTGTGTGTGTETETGTRKRERERKEKKRENFNVKNAKYEYHVGSTESGSGEEENANEAKNREDDIYMFRKYAVRHLLGYVIAKSKYGIEVSVNIHYRNVDIVDLARKNVLYEICCNKKSGRYSIRISKIVNLTTTIRQFECLFNFRMSSMLKEVIDILYRHNKTFVAIVTGNRSKNNDTKNKKMCIVAAEENSEREQRVIKKEKQKNEKEEEIQKIVKRDEEEKNKFSKDTKINLTLQEKIHSYLKKCKITMEYKSKDLIELNCSYPEIETLNRFLTNEIMYSDSNSSSADETSKDYLIHKEKKESYNNHRSFSKKEKNMSDRTIMNKRAESKNKYIGLEKYIPQKLKQSFFNIYNKYQLRAINNSVLNEGITLIQGPPGTGKTSTILGILSALLFYQDNANKRSREYSKTYKYSRERSDKKVKYLTNEHSEEEWNDSEKEDEEEKKKKKRKRNKEKFVYPWNNCGRSCYDDFHRMDKCYAVLEREDFSHYLRYPQEDIDGFFYFAKRSMEDKLIKCANGLHYGIMSASHKTLKSTKMTNVAMEETSESENKENRINQLIKIAKHYYDEYMNVDEYEMEDEIYFDNEKENKQVERYVNQKNSSGVSLSADNASTSIDITKYIKMQRLLKNKKILVCAPSNTAIDEIMERLICSKQGILDKDGQYFNPVVTRLGGNVNTNLLHFSLEFKDKLFRLLNTNEKIQLSKSHIIKTSNIICSTLSSSYNIALINSVDFFDAIIIDEASQAIELDILIPLYFRCNKVILVGDPKQLSATVFSLLAKKFKYSRSLFERLQHKFKRDKQKYNLLSIQYRMHPDISYFPKKCYYKNKIIDAFYFLFVLLKEVHIGQHIRTLKSEEENYALKKLVKKFNLPHFIETQFSNVPTNLQDLKLCKRDADIINWFFIPLLQHSVFYDVSFSKQKKINKSYVNFEESVVILQFIEFLHFLFISENVTDWYKKIGIITPYSLEKFFLKKEINEFFKENGYSSNISNFIEVGTVDGFQGTEKDIIIFVCVRTSGLLKRRSPTKERIHSFDLDKENESSKKEKERERERERDREREKKEKEKEREREKEKREKEKEKEREKKGKEKEREREREKEKREKEKEKEKEKERKEKRQKTNEEDYEKLHKIHSSDKIYKSFKNGKNEINVKSVIRKDTKKEHFYDQKTIRSCNSSSDESSLSDSYADQSNLFFSSAKRLNVALTRARHNLFIFGNCRFLEKCDTWNAVIEHYKAHNRIIKISKQSFLNSVSVNSKKRLERVATTGFFAENIPMVNRKLENSVNNRQIINNNLIIPREEIGVGRERSRKEPLFFDIVRFIKSFEKKEYHKREEVHDSNAEITIDEFFSAQKKKRKKVKEEAAEEEDVLFNLLKSMELGENQTKKDLSGEKSTETDAGTENEITKSYSNKKNAASPKKEESVMKTNESVAFMKQTMNTRSSEKEENTDETEKIKKDHMKGSHEYTLNSENSNYFMQTLYRMCQNNDQLRQAIKCALPNFTERFLFKQK